MHDNESEKAKPTDHPRANYMVVRLERSRVRLTRKQCMKSRGASNQIDLMCWANVLSITPACISIVKCSSIASIAPAIGTWLSHPAPINADAHQLS